MAQGRLELAASFDSSETPLRAEPGADFFSGKTYGAGPRELYTPVDPETGISLPILVTPEDFVLTKNRQHHNEHPAPRPELQDIAGIALRKSRTEQLPDHLHLNTYLTGYHKILRGPQVLPADPQSKTIKTLLHIGRVIPRQAVVLNQGGYAIKTVTDREFEFISHPDVTHIEGNSPRQRQHTQRYIGLAIVNHSINQEVDDLISAKVREEFLRTLDHKRERELGNQMLRIMVDETVKAALPIYERAKKRRMVDPRALGLRAIVRNYVLNDDFGNYFELLHAKLAPQEGSTVTPLHRASQGVELAA